MTKDEKEETFALVRGEGWIIIDHVHGDEGDGDPYLVGVSQGFDMGRILVYAYDEGSAEEIAEQEFPESMGSEPDDEEELEEAESEGRIFYAKDKVWIADEEGRTIQKVKWVAKGIADKYGHTAKLKTWPPKVVEYT